MVNVDVIRVVCVVSHYNTVSTSVFGGSLYGVGPVHQILKQGQSKSMGHGACFSPMSVLSIHISCWKIDIRIIDFMGT